MRGMATKQPYKMGTYELRQIDYVLTTQSKFKNVRLIEGIINYDNYFYSKKDIDTLREKVRLGKVSKLTCNQKKITRQILPSSTIPSDHIPLLISMNLVK